jgi:hypothetical protein
MGKMQREKGKRVERMCVHLLEPVYPDARRSANQSGGAIQPDVDDTPFWVECKGGKAPGLWAALRQAQNDRDSTHDGRPILLYLKWDRKPAVVAMPAHEWDEEFPGWDGMRVFVGKRFGVPAIAGHWPARLINQCNGEVVVIMLADEFVEECLKR